MASPCSGNLHPLGAILASIWFGGLLVGADQMQRTVQVPSALISTCWVDVLLVVGSKVWTQYRARRREINVLVCLPSQCC